MSVKLQLSSIQSESKTSEISLQKESDTVKALYQEVEQNLAATKQKLEETLSCEAKLVSIATKLHLILGKIFMCIICPISYKLEN